MLLIIASDKTMAENSRNQLQETDVRPMHDPSMGGLPPPRIFSFRERLGNVALPTHAGHENATYPRGSAPGPRRRDTVARTQTPNSVHYSKRCRTCRLGLIGVVPATSAFPAVRAYPGRPGPHARTLLVGARQIVLTCTGPPSAVYRDADQI